MRKLWLIGLIFLIIGCAGKIKTIYPKSAFVETTVIDQTTGIAMYKGWQEVRILEVIGNMAKIQWMDGGEIQWVKKDAEFKYLN